MNTFLDGDPAMATEVQERDRTAARPSTLEAGDHLDRAEFERRYDAMPNLKKAELIEGVVSMSSPVRAEHHGAPHSSLVWWLVSYGIVTPGVRAVDNASVRLDAQNMPQPDAALFIEPGKGGQARISVDDYLEGAPELVAEVSSSTVDVDLSVKLELYRRFGVREYLVWRVGDKAIDWFVLKDGAYERLPMDGAGVDRSLVFPGLWLDSRALVAGDLARVLAVLAEGLASAEHAAFKTSLQSRSTR